MDNLESMRIRLGSSNLDDVIKHSFALLDLILDTQENGEVTLIGSKKLDQLRTGLRLVDKD